MGDTGTAGLVGALGQPGNGASLFCLFKVTIVFFSIVELLFSRCHFSTLELFSQSEIDSCIDFCVDLSILCFLYFVVLFSVYFVYDFITDE